MSETLVDKETMETYDPSNPKSSPYEPTMGDIVIYQTYQKGERFPAIVHTKHDNDRVDLTVFTDTGVRYVNSVPFDTDAISKNTWHWTPTKVARPLLKETTEAAVSDESPKTPVEVACE